MGLIGPMAVFEAMPDALTVVQKGWECLSGFGLPVGS
jgi:hypothetical protein